jgi:hypothetical protein
LAILRQAYPQSQTVDARAKAALWADQFAQYSATDVYTAVKKYISTARFMPTVADIKSKLAPPEGLWELCMDLRMDNDFSELKLETAPHDAMEKTARVLRYGLNMEIGALLSGNIRSELARWEKRRRGTLYEAEQALLR